MPKVTGLNEAKAFIRSLPEQIEQKLLRGATRAGANVIAQEVRDTTHSSDIRGAVKVRLRSDDGRVVASIEARGPGSYLAVWEEYGTSPHFISVDDNQRGGRSVQRINRLSKEAGSLVIGGKFVGKTVFHPGARPHPVFRPALDLKKADAIKAAQAYIDARISRAGISGSVDAGVDE